MKYSAFLGRELSISASNFSPFADIKESDISTTQKNFGSKLQDIWHQWNSSQRIRVAAAVEKKKEEISKTTLKPGTKHENITSFILQKKSKPWFIDRAKGEPPHLRIMLANT